MPTSLSRLLIPPVAVLTATVLIGTALPAPGASAAPRQVERSNSTGTAAGSAPNGSAYMSLSLQTTSDGQILVSWKRPASPSRLVRFVVKVGTNRSLAGRVHSYDVNRTKQSVVVPQAFGATRASGNFSFVKLYVKRRNGTTGATPAKWIQAPLAAPCPATQDRVNIGTFNVRTWGGKRPPKRFSWKVRGNRVVHEIRRSGAHAVAIQEASGRANSGFGRLRQNRWIIARLNAEDKKARWVDARSDDVYAGKGLVGTRVIYDANAFRRLDGGLTTIRIPGTGNAYAPWVRLQATDGSSSPFVLMSTHLANGNSGRSVRIRNRQIAKVIELSTSLQGKFGGQVILGGDMNSTAYTKPYNTVDIALLRAGFYDAFATHRLGNSKFATTNDFDFPVRVTPFRRDYIMSLGPTQGSCRYVNLAYTRSSQAASDHFMQVATLPLSG